MEYTIERGRYSGVRLDVGRIPRRQIDEFVARHPQPEPPEKLASDLGIEVWGDPDAVVIDRNDPDYIRSAIKWRLLFGEQMGALVADAVSIPDDIAGKATGELEELSGVGINAPPTPSSILKFVVASDHDMAQIIDLSLYLSTVTVRGLKEAEREFGVRVRGRPVGVLSSKGEITASRSFVDRLSARWAGYTWTDFCELDGPEQSRIVAAHIIESKVYRRAT